MIHRVDLSVEDRENGEGAGITLFQEKMPDGDAITLYETDGALEPLVVLYRQNGEWIIKLGQNFTKN